jgi:pSer/pThr/pTyr-binding forkhead associated (FHA) protein
VKRCPVCHLEFPDKLLFCDQDGASLVKIAPTLQGKLTVSQPDGRQWEAVLSDNPVVLGKAPDSDIFIEDTAISRKHARIEKRGESHFIKDLNSLNGTLVNNQNIGQQEIELKDSDEIGIGRTN